MDNDQDQDTQASSLGRPVTLVRKDGRAVELGHMVQEGRKYYTVWLVTNLQADAWIDVADVIVPIADIDVLDGHQFGMAAAYLERRAALFRWAERREAQVAEIQAGLQEKIDKQTASALRRWERDNPAPTAPVAAPVTDTDPDDVPMVQAVGAEEAAFYLTPMRLETEEEARERFGDIVPPPVDTESGSPSAHDAVPTAPVAEAVPDDLRDAAEPATGVLEPPRAFTTEGEVDNPTRIEWFAGYKVGDPVTVHRGEGMGRVPGTITAIKDGQHGTRILVDVNGHVETHGIEDLSPRPVLLDEYAGFSPGDAVTVAASGEQGVIERIEASEDQKPDMYVLVDGNLVRFLSTELASAEMGF